MTDRRSSEVLGGLPNSRPHRRSDKRGAPADQNAPAEENKAPAEENGSPAPPERPATKRASAARSKPAPRSQGGSPPRKSKGAKPPSASKGPSGPKPPLPRKPAARSRAARPPLRQPAQPGGIPEAHRAEQPEPPDRQDLLGTAVQAAAELAEIGLSLGARALRSAMSRIPHP